MAPMNQKTLLPILLVPSCIVAIPAVAMLRHADGWNWTTIDFVVAWLALAAAVAAYKYVASKAPNVAYRVATGIAVVTGLVLLWINGAVGLIGSENNPANLMYGGVLAIGLLGAGIARLRPLGMARVLFVTAGAQFLVPVLALVLRPGDFDPGIAPVFGLNLGFVVMFAGAGFVFRHSGTREGNSRTPAAA
jgi:hypothetical protein